mmetsp:Transcript_20890/g.72050  ORF Transcript_20890/g.72050 Transcript_20890/m.72050 type:complete len:205 (-) Transcript_20890:1129-1743(-)
MPWSFQHHLQTPACAGCLASGPCSGRRSPAPTWPRSSSGSLRSSSGPPRSTSAGWRRTSSCWCTVAQLCSRRCWWRMALWRMTLCYSTSSGCSIASCSALRWRAGWARWTSSSWRRWLCRGPGVLVAVLRCSPLRSRWPLRVQPNVGGARNSAAEMRSPSCRRSSSRPSAARMGRTLRTLWRQPLAVGWLPNSRATSFWTSRCT